MISSDISGSVTYSVSWENTSIRKQDYPERGWLCLFEDNVQCSEPAGSNTDLYWLHLKRPGLLGIGSGMIGDLDAWSEAIVGTGCSFERGKPCRKESQLCVGTVAMELCYSFYMLYSTTGNPGVGKQDSGVGLGRESH